jgi:hypothetical protein
MATDYSPVYAPGAAFSVTTSGNVTAGQALIVSGDGTVAASSAASVAYVGIAAFDAASGADVTVLSGGVHILAATGAITAGELVTTATGGTVATQGAASAANDVQVIGVALTTAAASKVTVKLFR